MSESVVAIEHHFQIPLPSGPLRRSVYSYLLLGANAHAIDAGVKGSERRILAAAESARYMPQQLRSLLLTHAHPDHVGGAAALFEHSQCEVFSSSAERDWVERPELQARDRPVPGFWDLVLGGVPVRTVLHDGQTLRLDPDFELSCIATPGHSPGHLAFWDVRRRALFSGDSIPVPGALPVYDDAAASLAALDRLSALGVIDTLYSAWDAPRSGDLAAAALAAGGAVLRRMQTLVDTATRQCRTDAPLDEITRAVADQLELPSFLAGPMFARTVRAHLTHPIR